MFSTPRRFQPRRMPLLLLSLLSSSAFAANVMYLTGYGTESTYMGGADVAVARDTFAINNNPAGLSQIDKRALDVNFSYFYAEGATHTDDYGSYRRPAKNQIGGYGNLGYAEPIADSPFTVGMVVVVQGGLGWVYKNMTTSPALGSNRDEATSLFSIFKLAPGVSWRVNDKLDVGASVGLNYISGSQTLFPDTSVDGAFAGINFKGASGYGFTTKLGLQYRPVEDVVIGATWGSKTRLPMKGGYLRVNYLNWAGINQNVRYDDAELDGFGLPQEVALGISFRPVKPLLISIQNKWYDWSEVLSTSTLKASNPRNPNAPATQNFSSQVGAVDQHVYALGAAYDYSEKITLMAGVNYGRRAIPEQNLSPTFQVIQQIHYMFGVRNRINPEWMVDVGFERIPQQMVKYNNPATPFGDSVANHSGTVIHMTASRRW